VNVEHADHGRRRAQQRNGHERVVVLAAKSGNVAVARVGPLVVDEGRLAAFGDPAGDPLADRQSDRAGELVEPVGGGAHQHHRGPIAVDHVHEAGVGLRGGHDESRHLA